MTSAVRDAANGGEFADDVASQLRPRDHVLSAATRRRTSPTSAPPTRSTRPPTASATLVFDIGGGSTELVHRPRRQPDFHVSTQAGVVRQADRHITSDPPTAAELDASPQDVRAILDDAVPEDRRSGTDRALGVAGTPTSLAAIAQDLDPYDPERVHGYRLTAAERDAIFERPRGDAARAAQAR